MNDKAGCVLVVGAAAFALVGGLIAMGNPPPDEESSVAEAKPKPMMQRSWNTKFDGVTVSCGIVGDERWQIMFPTLEERAQSAQPIIDRAPTDEVWAKACGPSDPGSAANSVVK